MNLPPSTILALVLVCGFVIFIVARAIYRSSNSKSGQQKNASKKKPTNKPKRQEVSEKEAALEKFKQIHSAARDSRKKIAKEVDKDPQKTTKVLRSMMKQ